MSAEYVITHKHTLKILCKSLEHFHGDIKENLFLKENVSGYFFSEHSVYITALAICSDMQCISPWKASDFSSP